MLSIGGEGSLINLLTYLLTYLTRVNASDLSNTADELPRWTRHGELTG